MNTTKLIEIKRGIIKTCNYELMEILSSAEDIEFIFSIVFPTYELEFSLPVLIEKKELIKVIVEFFLIEPLGIKSKDKEGKYRCKGNKKDLKLRIQSLLEEYKTCKTYKELTELYEEKYNRKVKDFSKEALINRSGNLSDFAQALLKIYNS